jgi:hypothetical protein
MRRGLMRLAFSSLVLVSITIGPARTVADSEASVADRRVRADAPLPVLDLAIDASTLPGASAVEALPPAWPDGFPLPQGAELVSARTVPRPKSIGISAWFVAKGVTDLEAFFAKQLPSNGWTIVEEMSAAPDRAAGTTFYYAIRPDWVAGVTIGTTGQGAAWYEGPYDFYVYVFPAET